MNYPPHHFHMQINLTIRICSCGSEIRTEHKFLRARDMDVLDKKGSPHEPTMEIINLLVVAIIIRIIAVGF